MQIRNFLCEYRNGCVFEVGYNFQLFFSTPYGLFAYFPALNCIYFIVYCFVLLPVCSTLIFLSRLNFVYFPVFSSRCDLFITKYVPNSWFVWPFEGFMG